VNAQNEHVLERMGAVAIVACCGATYREPSLTLQTLSDPIPFGGAKPDDVVFAAALATKRDS
jgi:hypothetical protein